jgi:hypothetical protein
MADTSVSKVARSSCAKAVLVEPASIKARIPEGIQFSNLVFCFMFDFGLMVFVFVTASFSTVWMVANSRLTQSNLHSGPKSEFSPLWGSPLKPKPAESILLFHEHKWISINYSITHFPARMSPQMVTPALSNCRPKNKQSRTPSHHCSKRAPNGNWYSTFFQWNNKDTSTLLKTIACRINW